MLRAQAMQRRPDRAMAQGSRWLAGLCVLVLLSGAACAKKKSSKSMDAEFQAIGSKAMADFNAGAACFFARDSSVSLPLRTPGWRRRLLEEQTARAHGLGSDGLGARAPPDPVAKRHGCQHCRRGVERGPSPERLLTLAATRQDGPGTRTTAL